MTYYEDFSDYAYLKDFYRPRTKNIGWLSLGRDYPKSTPSEETLSLIWEFCKISVAQSRGIHNCEFCPDGNSYRDRAERNGEKLLLGTSEIRVFSLNGDIYAAPTLIYHYISVHHYRPPDEFLRALREGPRPPEYTYFARLGREGLEWGKTSNPNEEISNNGDLFTNDVLSPLCQRTKLEATFVYTKYHTPREAMPDSAVGFTLYLQKNVSEMRLTYQIKHLAFIAQSQGKKLHIRLNASAKVHSSLQDFVQKFDNLVKIERV